MAESVEDLDRQLKETQIETARLDLHIKKRELENQGSAKRFLANPVVLGAFITGFIALNTALFGFIQAYSQRELDAQKAKAQLEVDSKKLALQQQIEQEKFRTQMMLDAIKAPSPAQSAINIRFFLAAGLLSDPGGKIAKALEDFPKAVPSR
jgi:hypothetical protein